MKVTNLDIQNDKFDIGGGATFSTISELLEHYTRNPMVDQAGTVVNLKQVLSFFFSFHAEFQMAGKEISFFKKNF